MDDLPSATETIDGDAVTAALTLRAIILMLRLLEPEADDAASTNDVGYHLDRAADELDYALSEIGERWRGTDTGHQIEHLSCDSIANMPGSGGRPSFHVLGFLQAMGWRLDADVRGLAPIISHAS